MVVTVAKFAAMRGVSPATIKWLTTPPDTRPTSLAYVEVPAVFITPGAFARLWGAGDATIRYQVRRGRIPLDAFGCLDVHEGDLSWGLAYWDQVQWPENPNETDLAVLMTIEFQAIERELIRRGHIEQEDRIERQLACLARSTEWWRQQRTDAEGNAVTQQSDANEFCASRVAQKTKLADPAIRHWRRSCATNIAPAGPPIASSPAGRLKF
jgi:hypothetical protein